MPSCQHDVLPYARVRASLCAAVSAAQRYDWKGVLQQLSPELLSYPNPNTRAQARAMATWACWMLGDVDACWRVGEPVLQLARSDAAHADGANGQHLRYWILEALSPILAAFRSDLRSTMHAQRKALLEIFSLLEDTERLWSTNQAQYAVRYLEQLCILIAERRFGESAWLLRSLHRLAQQPLPDADRVKISECLASAELLSEIATARRIESRLPWPPELAKTAEAWRATRAGSPSNIQLCEGGLPGLIQSWLQALQQSTWQLPRGQALPRAFLAATACWAASLGRLVLLEREFPRQAVSGRELEGALATRVAPELAAALVHWCEHPSESTAQRLEGACVEDNWTCLLI